MPQLFAISTPGASTVEVTGAATPLPAALVHPLIVCVTEWLPAVVTVMELIVCPVLHNKDPVKPVAVNTELPQLSITVTPGVTGMAIGAAVALANELLHPSTTCDKVYVPAVGNVMELVVSPVLHDNDPVTPVAVKTELPQLLVTDIPGTAGVGLGADVALAAGLEQPFIACVTVYVPAVVTVIDDVVAPLLQSNAPV